MFIDQKMIFLIKAAIPVNISCSHIPRMRSCRAQHPLDTSVGTATTAGQSMKALLVYICLKLACNGSEINDDRDYILWTDKWQNLGILSKTHKWSIYESLKLRIMNYLF